MSSSTLSERAMLIHLTIGVWGGRRKDKAVSDGVTTQAHAERDSGSWWTRLVPGEVLRPIQAAASKGRKVHYDYTLPWMDGGLRILPANAYIKYTTKMREAHAEFDAAVSDFLNGYPTHREKAKETLGDLYQEEAYPHPADLARKYGWTVNVLPMPDANDFRVTLADGQAEEIRAEIKEKLKASVNTSMQDLWRRLQAALECVSERLSDPDKHFRNSLIGNVLDLCDLIPIMNITGDAQLDRLVRQTARKIGRLDVKDLRNDKAIRAQAAQDASQILAQIAPYIVETSTETDDDE